MTDDLVNELRDATFSDFAFGIASEAADRIEALTTQLAEDADVRTQIDYRLAELVAQVDALTAERDQVYERWNDCQEKRMVATARAEAAHRAMLVAAAETRMTMAELADWTARAEAEKADNARLRAELTKAADSLDWADAHLEDAGVVSANVRYGARDARAALTGEETAMSDLIAEIEFEAVNSEIDRHLAGRIIAALRAVQPDAAAIREAALREASEIAAQEGWPSSMSDAEYEAMTGVEEGSMNCATRIEAAILALIDNTGKEVMPDDQTSNSTHTRPDIGPGDQEVAGAAPVTVQEAARVLLTREAQKSVYDACSGVVKVYRFNAVLQSLSALAQKGGE